MRNGIDLHVYFVLVWKVLCDKQKRQCEMQR